MMKRLIILIVLALFVLTGCQPIQNLDLNKMVLNSSKVTSSEGQLTTSLDFTYNKSQVQDPDLLKVLNLLNHSKFEIQYKLKNSSTASLSGNLILQQGKIPFQLYVDQSNMVFLLDHASKPFRFPITQQNTTDTKLVQDFQTNLIAPALKNLPNPKHLTVGLKNENIHGTNVSGYSVHEEIYLTEVPVLLTTFINNLLKDTTAVNQMVSAINELDQTTGSGNTLTPDQFKSGLQQFETELNQAVPALQSMKLLSTQNYFKTDLFVDKGLNVRKSLSELKFASIPADLDLALTGLDVKVGNETWNINGAVNVNKISYSSYLDENASTEQVLATLDKRRSVLYSVIASFSYQPSKALTVSQVSIKNNRNKADTVTVKRLAKGDVVRIYKTNTGGDLWATSVVSGSSVTLSIPQLGHHAGKVYVSVIGAKKAESSRVAVGFAKER